MGEIVLLPVSPETCTVLGRHYPATSPCWLGLDLARAVKRQRSTLDMVMLGEDAPPDLHLDAPWWHPDDGQPPDPPEIYYRVRPKAEVGRRWRNRRVLAVTIERDDATVPPWVIRVEFAGGRRDV